MKSVYTIMTKGTSETWSWNGQMSQMPGVCQTSSDLRRSGAYDLMCIKSSLFVKLFVKSMRDHGEATLFDEQ